MGKTSDDQAIDHIISSHSYSDREDDDDDEVDVNESYTGIGSGDRSDEMMSMLRSMQMTMESFSSELSKLTTKVRAMEKDRIKTQPPKSKAKVPHMHALKITDSPVFTSQTVSTTMDSTPSRITMRAPSEARGETSFVAPTMFRSPYETMPQNLVFASSTSTFKFRSGTSNMGHNTKADIWDVAVTSVLVACLRSYIMMTKEIAHTIDEGKLSSIYSSIVSVLYEWVKQADLPAVHSPVLRFMARTLNRTAGTKKVPTSDAKTWVEMRKHTDGIEATAVIKSIILGAKAVP